MGVSVSERVIEDILSTDRILLAEVLSVEPSSLSLIARQKQLPSGRLDLLCLCEDELFLVELKAVEFYAGLIEQVNSYYEDLRELQKQHRLIDATIRKVVLVTGYSSNDAEICRKESIQLIRYDPQTVLLRYYENFREASTFLTIQSGDYGVVRLGLLKPTLKLLASGLGPEEISKLEGRSEKTIRNRLKVASLMGLVSRFRDAHFLTDFGSAFLEADAPDGSENVLSNGQVELLAKFIQDNPFYSSITYTLLMLVESVFILAKGLYPVPKGMVRDHFVISVGKGQTWKTDKARETATYIFSNYACEVDFLTSVENCFYLTPRGIRAILLLQLNRAIKLIGSQK